MRSRIDGQNFQSHVFFLQKCLHVLLFDDGILIPYKDKSLGGDLGLAALRLKVRVRHARLDVFAQR